MKLPIETTKSNFCNFRAVANGTRRATYDPCLQHGGGAGRLSICPLTPSLDRGRSASRSVGFDRIRPIADLHDTEVGKMGGMSSNTAQPSGYATHGIPCAARTAMVGDGRLGSAKQPPAKPVWPGLHAPKDLQ